MLFYQKMRKTREYNNEVLKQARFGTKADRLERNIKSTQKMYEGKLKQIQQTAERMKNQASVFFQAMNGLDANSINVNMMGFNGLTGFVVGAMQNMLVNNKFKNADGTETTLTKDQYNEMMSRYMTYGTNFQYYKSDGTIEYEDEDKKTPKSQYDAGMLAAFKSAMQQAQWMQSSAQTNAANMTQQYQNNVSIWQQAMEAQIEAEQEAALEPLEYEQTMMDLDKAACDERVARLKAELDSYTQACEQAAKDSAPKFGL